MDILKYLEQDHSELRRKLERLGRALSTEEALDAFDAFLEHFESHESIEEQILFPELARCEEPGAESMEFDYEQDHTELWKRLDALKDAMMTATPRAVRREFRALDEYIQGHLRCEEEIVYPLIRRKVSPRELEQMGEEAEALDQSRLIESGGARWPS